MSRSNVNLASNQPTSVVGFHLLHGVKVVTTPEGYSK
jgi:hypothetical protein